MHTQGTREDLTLRESQWRAERFCTTFFRGDSRSNLELSDCSRRNISNVVTNLRQSGKNCLHRSKVFRGE